MAAMFLLPIIALATGRNFVNVTYPDFLAHILPLSIVLIGLAFYWRSTGAFRPHDAKVLGWEAAVFLLARWPWSLAGSFFAVRDQITGSFVDFRITPKDGKIAAFPPLRVLAPYIVMSVSSSAAALLVSDPGSAKGYYLFAIVNSIVYSAVLAVIIIGHARENGLSLVSTSRRGLAAAATLVTVPGRDQQRDLFARHPWPRSGRLRTKHHHVHRNTFRRRRCGPRRFTGQNYAVQDQMAWDFITK